MTNPETEKSGAQSPSGGGDSGLAPKRRWWRWVLLATPIVIVGLGFLADVLGLVDRFWPTPSARSVVVSGARISAGESPCTTEEFETICAEFSADIRQHFESQFPRLQSLARANCRGSGEHAWLYERGYALLVRRYTSSDCPDFSTYQIPSEGTQIARLSFVRRTGGEFEFAPSDLKTLAGEPFDLVEVVRFCEDPRPWDIIRIDGSKFRDSRARFRAEVTLRRDDLLAGQSIVIYDSQRRRNGDLLLRRRPATVSALDYGSSRWSAIVSVMLPLLDQPIQIQEHERQLARLCSGGNIADQLRSHAVLPADDWVTLPVSNGWETPRQFLVFIKRRALSP